MGWVSSELIRGPMRPYPGSPTTDFLQSSPVLLRGSSPCSLFLFQVGWDLLSDLLTFLFYTSLHSLSFVHVQGQSLQKLIFVPSVQSRNCWGWFDKAAEYGSVRRWALSKRVVWITSPRYSGFPYKFISIPVSPLYSGGIMDLPRTKLSSAASRNYFVLCIVELGPQLCSDWAFRISKGKWAWSTNCRAPQSV